MRIGSGLAGALLMLFGAAAASANDQIFDRQVPAQPRGVVEISNVSGSIEVSGWDRAEVSVHAEVAGGAEGVEVSSESGHTSIKVRQPHGFGHNSEARLQVKIPKDSELDVSAVSADVATSGVLGIQRLSTVSGNVTAEIAGADVELKTVSGNVRIKGHGQGARLHVSSVSGDVHLEHGGGDIEAGTINGALIASVDGARSVRGHTTSGEVRVEGTLARGATVEASSVSGDLTVRAGAEGGYAYEVSSFSGDISDCFNASPEHSQHGPGSRLTGTRADGAGHVRLKTMSGNVQLCDRR